MLRGSLTGYIDVAQLTLYAFWIFFAGIILYLRREDKREGYPLEADLVPGGVTRRQGFPFLPKPKVFKLTHGGVYLAPNAKRDAWPKNTRKADRWPGSPLIPTGNPMVDGVGPASYAEREDEPERMIDGNPLIVPMRRAREASVDVENADPRGMAVFGADDIQAGTVSDVWVDVAEPQIRYFEVEASGRTVLLPMGFARVSQRRRRINVSSILARHFADVPGLKNPDQVTKLEEDRITAYYASGHLYAKPSRLGPLL